MSAGNAIPRIVTRSVAELSQPRLSDLTDYLTPVERFYVRDHFVERPQLHEESWRLAVTGLVERPRAFSLSEIKALPDRTLIATLECAGSGGHSRGAGRSQTMMTSMVSNARWRGISVPTLMEAVGLDPDMTELVFHGADGGSDPDEPINLDEYARSLPRDKALDPDTLLAYEMNDEPLDAAHGYPLRLLVPGWYGMDSVKWLVSIEAISGTFSHFYMDHRYREALTNEGLHTGRMVREMQVKSVISSPRDAARVMLGPQTIRGWAWAGEHLIEEVVVSIDGGETWMPAELGVESLPYAWRAWSFTFEPPSTGVYDLAARAQDSSGRVQPLHDQPVRTYEANWVPRIRVYVVDGLTPTS